MPKTDGAKASRSRGSNAVCEQATEAGKRQTRINEYGRAVKHRDQEDKPQTKAAQQQQTATTTRTRLQSQQEVQVAQPQRETRQRSTVKTTTTSKRGSKASASALTSPIKKGKQSSGRSGVKFYDSYEFNGDTYHVGEDVYVVETTDPSQLPADDVPERCCKCLKMNNVQSMIECSRCLQGFHMKCLNPPLKKVPEDDWLCPACERGEPACSSGRELRHAYEKFLFGDKILGLTHITGFVTNRLGDGAVEMMCKHYLRPEETHLGRQKHNTARQVLLGSAEFYEPLDSIFWKAVVCPPAGMEEAEGTDV
eukprot:CAMPEP_0202898728 /NCGR_PEP_ID=MMETSP1392-20130828/7170_1 /ASSEMBLY_ACC=CAM_ASM_000868 /TAXON_ID=225041 /ORGANISM="Chlamydomonas chlamydogama, Strain SAG 11-48b" /LENGTH=308 /DNA_ID=CAMNT_0049584737 /DNA_START=243 /DNA_END=1166 /DNA_ORIENTATION=-